MSIVLTEDQLREIDSQAERETEAVDPRTGRRFTLVPAEEYEALRDREEQDALRRASVKALARRLREDE
jgi:PHD/YefM family antitoxin component YafN of YafNO toxin-antitoxin module